jgi:hypothetical protein
VRDKSPVNKTQVKAVGVVWVRQHSHDHPATGNTKALKLLHLVRRRGKVACGTECFPRQARKILPVQPVGTDRTVSVELVEHGEIHLYTKVIHVRSPKENGMTNGEVLAIVNKNFITKNPETSKISQL